jgi:hypothetical protein
MAKKKIQSVKKYEFDINKIVEYLRPLSIKINELYTWEFKIESLKELNLFTNEELETLNIINIFDREIKLKKIITKKINELKLNNDSNFYVLANWIVVKWGGIKSNLSSNDIDIFLNSERPEFKRIASKSKVGAFLFPQNHIIYDSRVAYSLNWIILSTQAGSHFFQIPSGRNSKMCSFDINVLIRLFNISNYIPKKVEDLKNKKFINNIDEQKYISKNDSYINIRNLIKLINHELWKGDEEKVKNLYYTEMLLFAIEDKEVYFDIVNSVNLSFQKNQNDKKI